jgi:hypothetical protein
MLHQKVTDKFPTMEWLALAQIRKQFPELHRKGFMAAVRAAFSLESSEELPRKVLFLMAGLKRALVHSSASRLKISIY